MVEVLAWALIIINAVVALFQIGLLIVLILIALKVRSLIVDAHSRVGPLFTTAQETASRVQDTATTVQGTADYVTTLVVSPLIRAMAAASAAQRFFEVIFGSRRHG